MRLAQYVKTELMMPNEWEERTRMKFYTDSAIMCYWIAQEKKQLLTYVANCCE